MIQRPDFIVDKYFEMQLKPNFIQYYIYIFTMSYVITKDN